MSDNSVQQAKAQVESIKAMVAALEVDFDRLDGLRDERQSLQDAVREKQDILFTGQSSGVCEDGTPFDEVAEALADAESDLRSWEIFEGVELDGLEAAAGEFQNEDQVMEAIANDPLEVSVRSGWSSPCGPLVIEEFRILLCTGGPAVRLTGDLNEHLEPVTVRVEHQDWFEPWSIYYLDPDEVDDVLRYCQQFYFDN